MPEEGMGAVGAEDVSIVFAAHDASVLRAIGNLEKLELQVGKVAALPDIAVRSYVVVDGAAARERGRLLREELRKQFSKPITQKVRVDVDSASLAMMSGDIQAHLWSQKFTVRVTPIVEGGMGGAGGAMGPMRRGPVIPPVGGSASPYQGPSAQGFGLSGPVSAAGGQDRFRAAAERAMAGRRAALVEARAALRAADQEIDRMTKGGITGAELSHLQAERERLDRARWRAVDRSGRAVYSAQSGMRSSEPQRTRPRRPPVAAAPPAPQPAPIVAPPPSPPAPAVPLSPSPVVPPAPRLAPASPRPRPQRAAAAPPAPPAPPSPPVAAAAPPPPDPPPGPVAPIAPAAQVPRAPSQAAALARAEATRLVQQQAQFEASRVPFRAPSQAAELARAEAARLVQQAQVQAAPQAAMSNAAALARAEAARLVQQAQAATQAATQAVMSNAAVRLDASRAGGVGFRDFSSRASQAAAQRAAAAAAWQQQQLAPLDHLNWNAASGNMAARFPVVLPGSGIPSPRGGALRYPGIMPTGSRALPLTHGVRSPIGMMAFRPTDLRTDAQASVTGASSRIPWTGAAGSALFQGAVRNESALRAGKGLGAILEKEYAKMEKRIIGLQGEARRFSLTGMGLTKAITTPALVVGGALAYDSSRFEKRMAQIPALTDTPRAVVPALGKRVLGLSRELGQDQNDLASGLYEVASSGHRGGASLDVLTPAARGSAIGAGDTKVVAGALTSILAAYGQPSSEAPRTMDKIAAMINFGRGEAEQYAPALGKVVSTAGILGVGFDQVGASLATMSRLGISPSESATALNQLLMHVAAPTKQGKEALKAMGFESSAAARASLRDPAEGGKGLFGTLKGIFENPNVDFDTLEQLLGNVRGLKAALATTGVQADVYKQALSVVGGANGDVERGLKVMGDTAEFQWKRLVNAARTSATEISMRQLPGLAKDFEGLADSLPERVTRGGALLESARNAPGVGWVGANVLGVAGAGLLAAGPLMHAASLSKDLRAYALQSIRTGGGALPAMWNRPMMGAGVLGVGGFALGTMASQEEAHARANGTYVEGASSALRDLADKTNQAAAAMVAISLLRGGASAGRGLIAGMGALRGASLLPGVSAGIAAAGGVSPWLFGRNPSDSDVRRTRLMGPVQPLPVQGALSRNITGFSKAGLLAGIAPALGGAAALGLGYAAYKYYGYSQEYADDMVAYQGRSSARGRGIEGRLAGFGNIISNRELGGDIGDFGLRVRGAGSDLGQLREVAQDFREFRAEVEKDIRAGKIVLSPLEKARTQEVLEDAQRQIDKHILKVKVEIPKDAWTRMKDELAAFSRDPNNPIVTAERGVEVVSGYANSAARAVAPYGPAVAAPLLAPLAPIIGASAAASALSRPTPPAPRSALDILQNPNGARRSGDLGGIDASVFDPNRRSSPVVPMTQMQALGLAPRPNGAVDASRLAATDREHILEGLFGAKIKDGSDLDAWVSGLKVESLGKLNAAHTRLGKDDALSARLGKDLSYALIERRTALTELQARSGGLGMRGAGGTESGLADTTAQESQVAGIESRRDALQKLVSAYGAYGSMLDGVLGRIREFSERTEEARMQTELHKKSLDGVSDSLRTQALETARVFDKMKALHELRQQERGVWGGMQQSLAQAGLSPDLVKPFALQQDKYLGGYATRMRGLQAEGMSLGGQAALDASNEGDRLGQEINNLSAEIKALGETISQMRSGKEGVASGGSVSGTSGSAPAPMSGSLAGASNAELLAWSKSRTQGEPELSCAYGASQLAVNAFGLPIQPTVSAGGLRQNAIKAGWQRVPLEDIQRGDLIFNRRNGGSGWHVKTGAGSGQVINSNHRQETMYNYKPRAGDEAYRAPGGAATGSRAGSGSAPTPSEKLTYAQWKATVGPDGFSAEERAANARTARSTQAGMPDFPSPELKRGAAPARFVSSKGYTHTARSVAKRTRSAAKPEAQDPRAFRDAGSSALPMNGDWLGYVGGQIAPDSRNQNLFSLQQAVLSGEWQETTRKGLNGRGIQVTPEVMQRYLGYAASGAHTADAALNRNASHLAFEEQVRALRSRRFLRGRENDPVAQMEADRRFNPQSPFSGKVMDQKSFDALKGGSRRAWLEDESEKVKKQVRLDGIHALSLQAGRPFLAGGGRFDEGAYSRAIEQEEQRRNIWASQDDVFRNDPARANANARALFGSAISRQNADALASYDVQRRQREQQESDTRAVVASRMGVLRRGGMGEQSERVAAGRGKYFEVLDRERAELLARAQADAKDAGYNSDDAGFAAAVTQFRELRSRQNSPEAAARKAEKDEVRRLEGEQAAGNIARVNAELQNLPRGLAELYSATGAATKAFELFDSEAGRGLTGKQRGDLLDAAIGRDRAQAQYGLGLEAAGIGARNESERARAELEYWRANGRGELEKSLLSNPAIDAESRAKILGAEDAARELGVQRGGLESRRWGADAIQNGERAAAQARLQMQSARAVTDAQREAVYLEEATLDAKLRGLEIDEKTLGVLRGQARERVKQDNELRRFEALDKAFKGMESTVQSAMQGLIAGRDPLRNQGIRDEAYRWGNQAMDLRERGFAEDSPEYRNAVRRHRELEKAARPNSRMGEFKDTLFGGFGDAARGAASSALSNAAWGWLGQKIGGPLFGQGAAGGLPGSTPGINPAAGGLGGVFGSVVGALFGAGGGAGAPYAAQATMAVQNMTVQAQNVTINAASVNVSGPSMGGVLGGSGGATMQQTAMSMGLQFLVAQRRG